MGVEVKAMPAGVIAICSNPECTRHAAASLSSALPSSCPTCGSEMLDRCWKCELPVTDPFSSYCVGCGVPLKRVLPKAQSRTPLLLICSNPECDGAVETFATATLPSRCAKCQAPLISHCWKCGTRVIDREQQYCQNCGVPLKRLSPSFRT
jgi:hypothetical protein